MCKLPASDDNQSVNMFQGIHGPQKKPDQVLEVRKISHLWAPGILVPSFNKRNDSGQRFRQWNSISAHI